MFTSSGEGPGRVQACDTPHHLLVTMLPDTPDEQEIEAWLSAQNDSTLLVVENRGLPRPDLPLHGAGWQAHLEDLQHALAGEPCRWQERWAELTPAYQQMTILDQTADS